FVHGDAVLADVGGGGQPQPSDQPRRQIRDDVPVQVLHHHHVEAFGPHHELLAGVVHDQLLVLEFGKFPVRAPHTLQEKAVGQFHDVGFVDSGDLFAPVGLGVEEGEAPDPQAGRLGDDLQALDDAGDDDVFQAGVEVFAVLADDDQVDVVVAG